MNIENFYQALDNFFMEKKIDKAELFLKDTLSEAEAAKDFGLIIAACNELGGLYRVLSRYDEGMPLYEKALESLRRIGAVDSENYATTLINYATILSMSGRHEEVLDKYKEVVRILQSHGAEGDYRMTALYNNMSGLYQARGDYNAAAAYLRKALLILKNLTDSQTEKAISCSNLASIYIILENMADAENYAKKAVEIFRTEVGEEDVHYSAALCTLGEVHFAKGEYAQAEELFSEALRLIARDYGTEKDSYKVVERNLNLCREKDGSR